MDAFDEIEKSSPAQKVFATPRVMKYAFTPLSTKAADIQATPQRYPFATPVRPSAMTPFQTLPRTSTVRRTAPRRAVSDREAMKQLVNCVGMSARKKVLESGRKPRILTSGSRSRSSTLKELRFDRSVMVFNGDSGGVSYRMDPTGTTASESGGASFSLMSSIMSAGAPAPLDHPRTPPDTESSMDSEFMYSPSPSPRPGSVTSIALSRRSQTPTITGSSGSYVLKVGHGSVPSTDSRGLLSPSLPLDPEWANSRRDQPVLSDSVLHRSLSVEVFDDLDRRHTRLMQDIDGIGQRLNEVAIRVGGI